MKTTSRLVSISKIPLIISMLFVSIYALADELSEKDKFFLENTIQTAQYELEGSKLAVSKSSNATVLRFAKKTIQDYTRLSNELNALAKNKAQDISVELNPVQQENLQLLSGKEGKEFDAQYAAGIAEEAHANEVEYFTDASQDADDADIRSYAAKTQPGLRQHLFIARNLNLKINP